MAPNSLPRNEGAVSEAVICSAEPQSHLKLRELAPVLTGAADLVVLLILKEVIKLKNQNSGFSFEC